MLSYEIVTSTKQINLNLSPAAKVSVNVSAAVDASESMATKLQEHAQTIQLYECTTITTHTQINLPNRSPLLPLSKNSLSLSM